MDDRKLIADLLSALTRLIEFSKVAIEAAREYLRKPAQPMHPEIKKMYEDCFDKLFRESSPAQQEPVAWLKGVDEYGPILDWYKHWIDVPIGTMLYTSPPQRPWVGLTDEEIKEIVGPYGDMPIKGYTRKLFYQIEDKLREKNT